MRCTAARLVRLACMHEPCTEGSERTVSLAERYSTELQSIDGPLLMIYCT